MESFGFPSNEEKRFQTREEKNHQLFLRQKELLGRFLSTGAISKAQYEKSLHDLTLKMGEQAE